MALSKALLTLLNNTREQVRASPQVTTDPSPRKNSLDLLHALQMTLHNTAVAATVSMAPGHDDILMYLKDS